MKTHLLFVGLLLGMLPNIALSDDSDAFDVPNGMFRTLSSGALIPQTLITCFFSVDEVYFGSEWIPSVSIIFAEERGEDEGEINFKLSAYQSEGIEGWRHEFTVRDGEEEVETIINAHTGTSETILPMRMFWTEGTVLFYVGEDSDNFSSLNIAPNTPQRWSAVVGEGGGDCDSRLLA